MSVRAFTAASDTEILFEDDYMELRKRDDYTYAHEKRNSGVAIFVYRYNGTEVLGRYEPNPAHDADQELCSITGKIDEGETPEKAAVRELKEETGYECDLQDLEDLGMVYPYKGADYRLYLFAVDATNLEQGEAEGDGSRYEENSYCEWLRYSDALRSSDAVVGTLIAKWFLGQ